MKLFPVLPRFALVILFLLAAFITPLHAQTDLNYLPPGQPDAAVFLPPPPLLDSPEQTADMEAVKTVYHAASSNEIAVAYAEKYFSVFNFAEAAGGFFQSNTLPKTTACFLKIQHDAEIITDFGKDHFKRPRPFMTDPSLANGKLEKTFSYPSGHSTESMVLALVLADLLPARREAILAHARAMGWHRVQIARHYPTDIHAGRVLAQAIVQQLQKSDAFKKDLAAVKVELGDAETAAANNLK